MEAYRIADEPRPSTITHLAVNPFWPLFGLMFGGAWLAFPWYVLNGKAIGSPTLKREVSLAVIALAGSFLLAALLLAADRQGLLTKATAPYALLAMTIWKLGFAYWIYATQARTFSIYEHFGGVVRNGLLVVVLASILGRRLLNPAFESSLLLSLGLR